MEIMTKTKRSKHKRGKDIDKTQVVSLLVIVIASVAIFVIIDNPQALNLGTIVDSSPYAAGYTLQPEYRTPVGGQITVKFAIATWNHVDWVCSDLEKYRYDYDIWNDDTNMIVARAPSWLLCHTYQNEITLKMNKEGTYNYSVRETVVFLQENNRKMNGTVKKFIVIVGSGINPNPTPTPLPDTSTGGTVTVISEAIEEATVIITPAPPITFETYDAGSPVQTQVAIMITPTTNGAISSSSSSIISTATPVQQGTPVITPLTSIEDDSDLTFVPASEPTSILPSAKESSGFEVLLVIIVFCLLHFRRTD